MGGDTGKIIGYVAMAAAVAYTGYAMLGKTAMAGSMGPAAKGTATGFGKAGMGTGSLANYSATAPNVGFGFSGFGATPATTSSLGSLGSAKLGSVGGMSSLGNLAGAGSYGATTLAQPMAGNVVNTSYTPGAFTAKNAFTSKLANSTLTTPPPVGSDLAVNPDPSFLTRTGNYISENPLSSYFIGSGMLNQMTAPGMPDYPMADFTSLQAQKTYDQGLALMDIEELTREMERTDISPEQRNAIGRAMKAQGLDDQRIYESRVRGAMGGERQAGINEAVKQFNEDTNISDEELANQTAAIYAMYNSQSDPVYDKAETQLKQKWAQRGRYDSRGSDDATSGIAEARARTALENQTKAEAEALRRNTELTKMRQQGVNALLTGANLGDVRDRWDANYNENNRRYQLADLKDARQDNYSTSLLGLQGGQNYDLGNFQAQQNAANAQALQGLEMTRLGMRGFGDLVPIGSRRLYDSYYGI